MNPILVERHRLLLYLLAWALIGVGLALLLRVWLSVPWTAALLFGVPTGIVGAPMSLSAGYLCRAMPLGRTAVAQVATTSSVVAVVTAAVWAALAHGWATVITPFGLDLAQAPTGAVASLLVGVGTLGYLLSVTVHYLLQEFEESAEAGRRLLRSEIAAREAELRGLRAQLDPHFLFNSLNSISSLIDAEPDRARLMCQLLADFLRDSLRLGRSTRVALGREVALAEQYLRIEQVRFGNRLTVRTSVAPDVTDMEVPPLLLQPLVENAVGHGIATMVDGGAVDVTVTRVGDLAVVVVRNPRDMEAGRRGGTGFGQDIVRRRLAAAFGERSALAVEATADAYKVTVTMPIEETGP